MLLVCSLFNAPSFSTVGVYHSQGLNFGVYPQELKWTKTYELIPETGCIGKASREIYQTPAQDPLDSCLRFLHPWPRVR